MRFSFIDDQCEPDAWTRTAACEVLEVSRSGYYAWSSRHDVSAKAWAKASAREARHQQLAEQVRLSFVRSRLRYGAPRIAADLRSRGIAVCVNTVAQIMRENGLSAQARRRFVPRTTDSNHHGRVAPNRLKRKFAIKRIDRVWAGDISYIPSEEGWLYLATLMDLCSRYIVGWAMGSANSSELTCGALNMAIQRRRPRPGLICHSDRGRQYACDAYQRLLKTHGLICSMSRRGNCYDNAPKESFFATLKRELETENFQNHAQAQQAIFEFIEVFYNRKRLHSGLGYQSPEQFEAAHRKVQTHAPAQSG
jgi:transposase InsO family protein